MNRKKFTRAAKIVTASLVAFTMTASPVFAATGDLWKGTTNKGSVAQMILGGSAGRLDFATNIGQYTYEVDGVGYAVGEVDTMFKANPTLSPAEVQAKVKAELTGTPVSDELVVESVSAITGTVDIVVGQKLEFAINSGTEAADLAALAEEGYTVEFLASKAVFTGASSTSSNGVLVALAADTTFKYQVKVSKAGAVVAESELKEVTVQDKANKVTSISAIELYVTQNGEEVKVESGKLATGDVAKVVVMGRTAALAADADDADITAKVGLSTSKVAIATVATTGAVTQTGAKGDVTITAKVGDIVNAITVNAGNTARAVNATKSSIAPASLELATGDSADIVVSLKDQYGDTFVTVADAVKTAATNNADADVIAAAVATSTVEDDLTVKLTLVAHAANFGTGKVVVNHNATKLGEISLTVKAPGEIAEYKLETIDKKYELELMGASAAVTLQLLLNGYDAEGLFVAPTVPLANYSFESSDEDVAAVDNSGEVTAVATGTAVIKIYETADAFKTTVAEVTVMVKDSTPSIADATVATPAKVVAAGDITLADLFTKVTALDPEGKAVDVNAFSTADVTVGAPPVKIGSFLVTSIIPAGSTIEADPIASGKIAVSGTGKATINIALLNANGEIVKDVDVLIDIQ
ncbi:Ig-like domain-containing protein [Desulfitobacterium chlororespirans]|uniref:Ig-like domain (Group 2) n=1 Tax=Desulfitobacterium chlororespirans DSM 11544 TaxID=1121395 RepID=A0A1M7U9C0_9FIRM|nr:hypothetical protein [Desulfitobacterium chlororespirans]SHN79516.1 hypothetical protein SAMN02745215_03217 [Desulfitobacterium chlororespirans DSM 11544]